MTCITCHMFFCVGLIKVIICFYLKLTLLYIGIVPEDLWVKTLLLINSFGAAIFSVRTSLLFRTNRQMLFYLQ